MISLPKLPYELNALEPALSKQAINLHYNMHHTTYVKNLNKLLKDTKYEGRDLEYIVKNSGSGPIFDNASQCWAHEFYWNSMSPNSEFDPSSELGKKLVEQFGSIDGFKKQFKDEGSKLFGSGWVYLIKDSDKLIITRYSNANSPISDDRTPLLVCDVWEHAYLYMEDYFADRAAYIDGFFKVINWKFANDNYVKKGS